MATPSFPLWIPLILPFNQPVLQLSRAYEIPGTSSVAPETHMWENELSPWYHLFVLLHTPCTVSVWIKKNKPFFRILRKCLFLQKPAANAAN